MVKVVAWPPVAVTGWELTRIDQPSVSRGIFTGARRSSAADRRRRAATAIVPGRGIDASGAGYIEMLKEMIDNGAGLVRVECRSAVWHLRDAALRFASSVMSWTDGSGSMVWSVGSSGMAWLDGDYPLSGVPGTLAGLPVITVSGLPRRQIVARPSELLRVHRDGETQQARVRTLARSDALGGALIRLMTPITISGSVSIGDTESIVFEALDMPRAVQPVRGEWAWTWNFREVFEAETDGFEEVNPWL